MKQQVMNYIVHSMWLLRINIVLSCGCLTFVCGFVLFCFHGFVLFCFVFHF